MVDADGCGLLVDHAQKHRKRMLDDPLNGSDIGKLPGIRRALDLNTIGSDRPQSLAYSLRQGAVEVEPRVFLAGNWH
jgi:hypothetical protein